VHFQTLNTLECISLTQYICIWFLKGERGGTPRTQCFGGWQTKKIKKLFKQSLRDSLTAENAAQYVRRRTQDVIELE